MRAVFMAFRAKVTKSHLKWEGSRAARRAREGAAPGGIASQPGGNTEEHITSGARRPLGAV
jgi:hypothetical protein